MQHFGDLSGINNRDYGQFGALQSVAAAPRAAAADRDEVGVAAVSKRDSKRRKFDLAGDVTQMAESLSTRLQHE